MAKIIGVDGGNFKVKAVGATGPLSFYSNICDWFERGINEQFGNDDMEFIINGRAGFAGSIAKIEDEFGGVNMLGNSKAHVEAQLRILLAAFHFCNDGDDLKIVVGQPIGQHTPNEKSKIKKLLIGWHNLEVNGIKKTIFIDEVEIAPEGSAAVWSVEPTNMLTRILDVGSGTVNAATITDKRKHVTNQSTTFNFGAMTTNQGVEALARGIIKNASKKWHREDYLLICGGVSEKILPHIQDHFINAELLRPVFNGIELHPMYANAVGFYKLAKMRFK